MNDENESKVLEAVSQLASAINNAAISNKKIGYITVKVGFYEQNRKAGK